MRLKSVIFDMDGVLVDTEPIYVAINRGIFKRLGVEISVEHHLSYVGNSAVRMWGEIKRDFGLVHSVEELIRDEKRAQLDRFEGLKSIPPIPGIRDLIDRLRTEGIPFAVASSSPPELIELILGKAELDQFFEVTVSGDDVEKGKPAPDIFLLAAKRLSVDPESCLVIEDSPHGVRGANAAGMITCGFLNPNSGNQDLSDADFTVDHFYGNDLKRILGMI